ncbi:MAG: hypothetical protein O8C61_05525 [Candidatus Methanoperedens sp.]|nr:hypothetical protein [Candidatus Methanoperedens sp.]
MKEILSSVKKSIIRGIDREKSEKERIVESIAIGVFFAILIGGIFVCATSPVKFNGDFEVSGNFDLPKEMLPIGNSSNNFTVNSVKFQGEIEGPAYEIVPIVVALHGK